MSMNEIQLRELVDRWSSPLLGTTFPGQTLVVK